MLFFFGHVAATVVLGERGPLPIGAGLGGAIIVVANAVEYVRGYRRPDEIPLGSIRHVRAIDGRAPTRPRFDVVYVVDGEERRRRVSLPSRYLPYAAEEYERIEAISRQHDEPVESAA